MQDSLNESMPLLAFLPDRRIFEKDRMKAKLKMKPIKAYPNSPLAQMMPKILEDKKWFNAYLRGEITREELEAKGVKLMKCVSFATEKGC